VAYNPPEVEGFSVSDNLGVPAPYRTLPRVAENRFA
jgi:hypothetical protein